MVSFRTRAALLLGLLFAASMALLSLAVGSRVAGVEQRDQGETLHSMARAAALAFADGLAERLREVEVLAATLDAERDQPDARGWQRVIDRVQASHRPFAWIGVADAEGRVVAASNGLLLGSDVGSRPWAAAEAPVVGDVHEARLLQGRIPSPAGMPLQLLDIAAPVLGRGGQRLGVLGAHVNWTWARDVIASVRSAGIREQGVQFFIVGRGGQILLHPPAASHVTDIPDTLGETAQVLVWPGEGAFLSAAVRVPATVPAADLGWHVVVRQPAGAALRGAAHARDDVMLLGALAVVAGAAGVWLLLGFVSRPLQRMAEAAVRLDRGELDVHLPQTAGVRELDQFGAALDRMAHRLIESNRTLEARVAARTAELERANAELEKLATRDALTGLYNRRAADARLAAEIARHRRAGAPLALLLLDIDHFKRVNDTLGHAAGDRVLMTVAERLRAACRETDFVARTGGEEFLVLLPHTGAAGAQQVADKLLQAVAAEPCGSAGPVTVSIGCLPDAQRGSADAALQRADAALYAAKHAGRNRVVAEAVAATA